MSERGDSSGSELTRPGLGTDMLAIERDDSATTPNDSARTAHTTGHALLPPRMPAGSEVGATHSTIGVLPAPEPRRAGTPPATHPHTVPPGVATGTGPDTARPLHPADLPDANALICALAGQHMDCALCRSAHELVDLHRHAPGHAEWPEALHTRRATLISGIDLWARRLPPPRCGARPHPESLGELIDRIAAAAAHAFHLLMTDDLSGDRMHAAWTRLAELELGYADLLSDIRSGRRYLPPAAALGGAGQG
jgi:hypothetical protein